MDHNLDILRVSFPQFRGSLIGEDNVFLIIELAVRSAGEAKASKSAAATPSAVSSAPGSTKTIIRMDRLARRLFGK